MTRTCPLDTIGRRPEPEPYVYVWPTPDVRDGRAARLRRRHIALAVAKWLLILMVVSFVIAIAFFLGLIFGMMRTFSAGRKSKPNEE